MDASFILQYLKDIAANNNREWFAEHRSDYEKARSSFEEFLSETILQISLFDESVCHVQPKDCTYRFYRDIRFSPDKRPFKLHFGGYINPRGKKSSHCGYYVHLQPGACMLAGGSYNLPSPVLRAIRQSIYDDVDHFRSIVEDPSFKQYFPVVGDDFLKTAPVGFPKDYPYIKYLQPRQYTCAYPVEDTFFYQSNCMERMMDVFRQFKRYADFLNETIDEF